MRDAVEFLLRVIDANDPAHVSREDFDGRHGDALRVFRNAGFIAGEPCMNPVPSCPYCFAGVPHLVEDTYYCPACGSAVDREDLRLWRLDLASFLRWLSISLGLEGAPERVDESLWRMGALGEGAALSECFYLRGGRPTDRALGRLRAFRSVIIFHGRADLPEVPGVQARVVSLLELITVRDDEPRCASLSSFIRSGGRVRFDAGSGTVYAGEMPLGRVDLGTREFHLIECLALHQGSLVPYAEVKQHVCGQSGSRDGTDEATFCQKLKSRLKSRYRVDHVDRLIEKDARGGGYRLVDELRMS